MTDLLRGHHGLVRLHLQDEAPRLGSGWRLVEVTIGNKHATLRVPNTTRTAKVPRALFNAILEGSRHHANAKKAL